MSEDYLERLAALQKRFAQDLDSRLAQLLCVLNDAREAPIDGVPELHHQLHELAGNAGMLFFHAHETQFRGGIRIVEEAEAERRALSAEEESEIVALLDRLKSLPKIAQA